MKKHELDILLNRYLDGRLDPEQIRWLEQAVAGDSRLRQSLAQLQNADSLLKSDLPAEADDSNGHFETIFHQAQDRLPAAPVSSGQCGWLRFAAGLAAGLILGWAGHWVALSVPLAVPAVDPAPTIGAVPVRPAPATPVVDVRQPMPVVRDVDLYIYTDYQGDRWVLEGIRENRLQPEVQTVVY